MKLLSTLLIKAFESLNKKESIVKPKRKGIKSHFVNKNSSPNGKTVYKNHTTILTRI